MKVNLWCQQFKKDIIGLLGVFKECSGAASEQARWGCQVQGWQGSAGYCRIDFVVVSNMESRSIR